MLRLERFVFSDQPPLNIEVAEGQCLAIDGPSGSGKTRLLRAIADLDESKGHVSLDGIDRREVTAPQWRTNVRYVSAEPGWWTETPRQALAPGTPNTAQLKKQLSVLNLEPDLLDRHISHLSTGERQRLALIRALRDEPRAILLDEPTAALDAENTALVEELIRYQLLRQNIVLLISHDRQQIARLATAELKLPITTSFPQLKRGPRR